MTSVQQRSAARRQRWPAATTGHLGLLTGVLLLAVLSFGVGLLLPYHVNGLHRVPLGELGAYEPERLWPMGTGWLPVVNTGFVLAMLAFPALVLAAGAAAAGAVRAARTRVGLAPGFAVLALACGAAAVWLWGPTGSALVTWRID